MALWKCEGLAVLQRSVLHLIQNASPIRTAAYSQARQQNQSASIGLLSWNFALHLPWLMVWFKLLCGTFIPSQSFFCQQREDDHFFLTWFPAQSSLSSRTQLQSYNHSKSHLGQIKCCTCNLTILPLLLPVLLILSDPLWKIDLLCFSIRSLSLVLEFWLWNILFPLGMYICVCLKFPYTE